MQGSKGFVQRKLPLLVPTRLTLEKVFFFPLPFQKRGRKDIYRYRKGMIAGYHTANGIIVTVHTWGPGTSAWVQKMVLCLPQVPDM